MVRALYSKFWIIVYFTNYNIFLRFFFLLGGNYGVVNITIHHSHDNGTLWILGTKVDSYADLITLQKSCADCTDMINKAHFVHSVKAETTISTSHHFVDTIGIVQNSGDYANTYWVILNCRYNFQPSADKLYSR
jgi:hypothetical protein